MCVSGIEKDEEVEEKEKAGSRLPAWRQAGCKRALPLAFLASSALYNGRAATGWDQSHREQWNIEVHYLLRPYLTVKLAE